jgi:CBS domain-containing protein
MKVADLMQREVRAVTAGANLAAAGRLMAEAGCGALPVLAEGERVVGVITDRDVCLALAATDRRPSEVEVREAMSREVFTCRGGADLRDGLRQMRGHRVRRLPVVDEAGRLAGILCLDDIVLQARPVATPDSTGPLYGEVAETLRAVCGLREPLAV